MVSQVWFLLETINHLHVTRLFMVTDKCPCENAQIDK